MFFLQGVKAALKEGRSMAQPFIQSRVYVWPSSDFHPKTNIFYWWRDVFCSCEDARLSELAEAVPWIRWGRGGGRLFGETFDVDLQIKRVIE